MSAQAKPFLPPPHTGTSSPYTPPPPLPPRTYEVNEKYMDDMCKSVIEQALPSDGMSHTHKQAHTACAYSTCPTHTCIHTSTCASGYTQHVYSVHHSACCPSTHIPPPQPHIPTHYTQILVTAEKLTINVCS